MNKAKRIDFHNKLVAACGRSYYQPTQNTKLEYPCIVYEELPETVLYANDKRFETIPQVQITVIDRDPDSEITEKLVERFPESRMVNKNVVDNLYHTIYELYI